MKRTLIDRARADQHGGLVPVGDDMDDPLTGLFAALRSPRAASLEPLREAVMVKVFALVSADDADLIRARFLEDRSAAEVATDLGIGLAALDQRVARAKRRFRDALLGRPDLVAELRQAHPHVYPTPAPE